PRAALRVAAVSTRNPYPNPSWPFHFFAQSLPRRSPPRLLRRRRHPRARAPARCQTPKDGNFHISSPLQLHDHPTEQRASSDQHHKAAPASDELPSKEHADDTAGLESEARLARRRRLQGEAHRSRGAGERDRRARGQLHPGRGRGCRPRPALLLPRRRVLHVRRQGPGGLHRPVGPVVPRRRPGRRRVRAHLRRVPDVRLRHPDAQGGRPVLAPRSHVISNS
ncbi:hypothetical protein U9M48_032452, partial [Paspalum notatum var. saurae]